MKRVFHLLCALGALTAASAESVHVRVHNFVVNPSTGPTTAITVTNPGDEPFAGTLVAKFPHGWQVSPESQTVALAAGASKAFPFAIEKATDARRTNRYDVVVCVSSDKGTFTETQAVVWASAPYFKPTIDGKAKEWADAVPIKWMVDGRQTVVSQYWNKKRFCLLVQVEEDNLVGRKRSTEETGVDAIQFALAPTGATTGRNRTDKALRYEFLAVDSGSMWTADACFCLTQPGALLGDAVKTETLDPLRVEDAEVVVKRSGKKTVYELSIPFARMPTLRPTAGREYCFSLLVHDPDGTGIRDLGAIMNLPEDRRSPLAWCAWPGVKRGAKHAFDGKVEFGFCSSVH